MFLFFNPICHPGVIARLSEVREFLYHEAFTCSEDLKLWTDMLCAGRRFAVQDEYLLLYRVHGGQVTAATGGAQREPIRPDHVRYVYQAFVFAQR